MAPVSAAPPATAIAATSVAPPGPDAIVIEAEALPAGNAVADNAVFRSGTGVPTSPKIPASAQYRINIPATGNDEIYARYALGALDN